MFYTPFHSTFLPSTICHDYLLTARGVCQARVGCRGHLLPSQEEGVCVCVSVCVCVCVCVVTFVYYRGGGFVRCHPQKSRRGSTLTNTSLTNWRHVCRVLYGLKTPSPLTYHPLTHVPDPSLITPLTHHIPHPHTPHSSHLTLPLTHAHRS